MFLAFTKIRLTGMSALKKQSTREIERKFLLKRFPPGLKKFPHDTIVQGYLAVDRGGLQVRLRKKGSVLAGYSKDQGFFGHRREVLTASPESPCVRRYDSEKCSARASPSDCMSWRISSYDFLANLTITCLTGIDRLICHG